MPKEILTIRPINAMTTATDETKYAVVVRPRDAKQDQHGKIVARTTTTYRAGNIARELEDSYPHSRLTVVEIIE